MVKVTGVAGNRRRIQMITEVEIAGVEVGAALFAAGSRIQTTAQRLITEGSIKGKFHVRSKPGEPPNADTGTLDGAIETVQIDPLKVEVSSNAPYAAFLEYGTSKMAARPYMGPATELEREAAYELVRQAVDRAIKRIAQ